MPKLVPIKYKNLIKILHTLGFVDVRSKGSHHFFEHADGRTTVVPFRKQEIGKGLLKKILQDIKVSVGDYEELRKSY